MTFARLLALLSALSATSCAADRGSDVTSKQPSGTSPLLLGPANSLAAEEVLARVGAGVVGASALRAVLRARGEGSSVDAALDDLITLELLAAEAIRQGLNDDSQVRSLRRASAVRRYIEAEFEPNTGRADVPGDALKRTYKQNFWFFNSPEMIEISHVYAGAGEGADEAAWAALKTTMEGVRGAVVAAEPGSAELFLSAALAAGDRSEELKGERLSWVNRDSSLVPEFIEAAFALDRDGAISPLLRTRYGWHILYRSGRKDAKEQSFEHVRDDVLDRVHPSWRKEAFRQWVEEQMEGYPHATDPALLERLSDGCRFTAPRPILPGPRDRRRCAASRERRSEEASGCQSYKV